MVKNDKILENMTKDIAKVVENHQKLPIIDGENARARNAINAIIKLQKENPNIKPLEFLLEIRHYVLKEGKAIHTSDMSEKEKKQYQASLGKVFVTLAKHQKNAEKLQKKSQMHSDAEIRAKAVKTAKETVKAFADLGIKVGGMAEKRIEDVIKRDIKQRNADPRVNAETYASGVVAYVRREQTRAAIANKRFAIKE